LAHDDRILQEAVNKLTAVNDGISKQPWDESDDATVRVCKVLCAYLKITPRVPSRNISDKYSNLTEEILYLSGVRCKEVQLPARWWKHSGGVMLGAFTDGTPIALLPNRLFGYSVFDPRSGKTYKVTAKTAQEITPLAHAAFRTFSAEKVRLRNVFAFILGENMYKELAFIALFSFLASIIQMIPPIISAQIFDVLVPGNLRVMLVEVVFILVAFQLANAGFSIMTNISVARINTKGGLAIQAALWDRLLTLRIPFFYRHTTGELIQKINSIEQVKKLISMETLQTIFSNLFAFVYIIVLFNFNRTITPYVLLLFLALFVINGITGVKKYKLFRLYTNLENKQMGFTHQCTKGILRIKASCAEARIFHVWSGLEAEKRRVRTQINRLSNGLNAFQLFFDFVSTAVVYLLIANTPNMGVGIFIAYLSAFLIFQKSMRKLLKALGILPELFSVCANVKPILDAEPEYSGKKIIPKDLTGTLEVNNIRFRFSPYGADIIKDVSFRIEAGQSVGIVGLSGGGKTTMIKLLMGLYTPTGGKIYCGGYDLETLDMRYLRKQVGVVLQSGGLTVGDIYSNVTNNDDSITEEAVTHALEKVGLSKKIKTLPQGLHTKLETCSFSDGERQRLLIARAIVKARTFIFFDEATQSLDAASRDAMIDIINQLDATKIIVAQQMEAVRHCDKVIVIEEGRVKNIVTASA